MKTKYIAKLFSFFLFIFVSLRDPLWHSNQSYLCQFLFAKDNTSSIGALYQFSKIAQSFKLHLVICFFVNQVFIFSCYLLSFNLILRLLCATVWVAWLYFCLFSTTQWKWSFTHLVYCTFLRKLMSQTLGNFIANFLPQCLLCVGYLRIAILKRKQDYNLANNFNICSILILIFVLGN